MNKLCRAVKYLFVQKKIIEYCACSAYYDGYRGGGGGSGWGQRPFGVYFVHMCTCTIWKCPLVCLDACKCLLEPDSASICQGLYVKVKHLKGVGHVNTT